jgi:hypothetical protein
MLLLLMVHFYSLYGHCEESPNQPCIHFAHTHITVSDKHFIAPMAGSRIGGVIWLKAISKAGVGLHSNLSSYLPSFCAAFYQDDGLSVRVTCQN